MIEARQELVHIHAARPDVEGVVFTHGGVRQVGQRFACQDRARERIEGGFRNPVPRKRLAGGRIENSRKRLAGERIRAAEVAASHRICGQQGCIRKALADSQAFIIGEEKGAIAPQWSAQAETELILAVGRNWPLQVIEKILGVQGAVTQELVGGPGQTVGPGARGDIDLRTRGHALLGGIGILHHAELADGIDGRIDRQAVRKGFHEGDPVE